MIKTEKCKEKYEGLEYYTSDGLLRFKIIEFISSNDVIIEFEGGYRKHVQMFNITNGAIKNPFANSPIVFDSPEKEYLGTRFQTNEGYIIQVIKYENSSKVYYKFLDEFGYEGCTTGQNIRKGQVKNPFKKLENGGFLGVSQYNTKEFRWLYNLWNNLLNRATGRRKQYHISSYGFKDNFVANSAISSEWMCYANFANWYMTKLSELNPNCKYELNKDILINLYGFQTNGVRFYGPDTVELIPEDLNTILFNNKNKAKSEETRTKVSKMADFYRSQNMLTERSYNTIKRFFCKEENYPVHSSIVSIFDQENLFKNNLFID